MEKILVETFYVLHQRMHFCCKCIHGKNQLLKMYVCCINIYAMRNIQ